MSAHRSRVAVAAVLSGGSSYTAGCWEWPEDVMLFPSLLAARRWLADRPHDHRWPCSDDVGIDCILLPRRMSPRMARAYVANLRDVIPDVSYRLNEGKVLA